MTTKFHKKVVIVLMLLFSATAFAQEGPSLMTYDLAMKAIEAAESHARQQGWNVTILVTDQNATPVMLRRLDGASARTITIANSRALVVTKTGLTSGEYGTRLEAGEIEEIEGGVTFQGGVPVYLEGELIGAVAASGVRGFQDEEVSIVGAETIGSISKD
ncbi:MAG: heme-binding protein [Gammaproteobacteria bacterium]|nr:heme-binding protein [Gammaproteobacteria bacterium]